jgi:hypothetical protein
MEGGVEGWRNGEEEVAGGDEKEWYLADTM